MPSPQVVKLVNVGRIRCDHSPLSKEEADAAIPEMLVVVRKVVRLYRSGFIGLHGNGLEDTTLDIVGYLWHLLIVGGRDTRYTLAEWTEHKARFRLRDCLRSPTYTGRRTLEETDSEMRLDALEARCGADGIDTGEIRMDALPPLERLAVTGKLVGFSATQMAERHGGSRHRWHRALASAIYRLRRIHGSTLTEGDPINYGSG